MDTMSGFNDVNNKTRAAHEAHLEDIKRQYAAVYGPVIRRHLNEWGNDIPASAMDVVCQYVLNYKNDLARFGIEAWKEKGQ